MHASAAILFGLQVRSGVDCHTAVGSAAGSTTGAVSGSATGVAAESSERITMLRRNSGFENFPNCGGVQSSPDVRNQQRTERADHLDVHFWQG